MSYDLTFWRQQPGMSLDPNETYRALNEGSSVEGLVPLPIEDMLRDLVLAFPSALRERNGPDEWVTWSSADGQDSFQVEWSGQHMTVACRHVHSDDMNKIVNIGVDHGCPLFDPQVGERFAFDGL